MIRPPSSAAQAAKILFGAWVFLTVIVVLAGGPWLLPTGIVGGALIVGLPLVFILRALPAQARAVTAANASETKQFEQLNEYERAGFQVRRQFLRGYVVRGVLGGLAFTHFRTFGGRYRLPSTGVSIASSARAEFDVRPSRDFDRRYSFAGSTPGYADAVLSDPRNVEHLAALFAGGAGTIGKRGDALAAVAIRDPWYWPIARIEATVKALAALRLPADDPGAAALPSAWTRKKP